MKDGFIKVGAYSPQIKLGDCEANANVIIEKLQECNQRDVKIALFPELSVTGYTLEDLFLQNALLDSCLANVVKIARATEHLKVIAVYGAPIRLNNKLFNCAIVAYRGEILGIVPKSNIPNYGEFYEARRFSPAGDITEICIDGKNIPFGSDLIFCCEQKDTFKFGVEICEDLWVACPPAVSLTSAGATIMLNLSASDEVIGKADYRRTLVNSQSAKTLCGYVYCDAGEGESTTDLVFSGHNIISENGTVLAESKPFEFQDCEGIIDVDKLDYERRKQNTFVSYDNAERIYFSMPLTQTNLDRKFSPTPFIIDGEKAMDSRCEEIIQMQARGLAKRIEHTSPKKIVLGISGGLDSALALLVCVKAYDILKKDRKDILAVSMPCFGTSERTRSNAKKLPQALGVSYKEVDITEAVRLHFRDIGHDEARQDVTFENSQARERTQVLMDLANEEKGFVIGTGDLSELALGWATYNGDHMSMYGVNASIPKTLVKYLVAYSAKVYPKAAAALNDILATPVSPELIPPKSGEISQKTEELVGDYKLHDFFLYYAIRWGFSPKKVFRIAVKAFENEYDAIIILKWLKNFYKRFFSQQFKRSCLPDSAKVGSVSLSPRGDWRMPSDACVTLWSKELDEIKL